MFGGLVGRFVLHRVAVDAVAESAEGASQCGRNVVLEFSEPQSRVPEAVGSLIDRERGSVW